MGRGSFGLEREELITLLRVSHAQVAARLAVILSVWAALGWAVLHTEHLALKVVLWVLMGFNVTGLIQMAHETWHGNLFRQRWANQAFGVGLGLLVGISHEAMRHDHLMHHRHNRTPQDPDAYNAGEDTLGQRALFYSVVCFGLVLSVIYFNILYPLQHFARESLPGHFARLGLAAAGYAALWWGLWRWGLAGDVAQVWLVPILTAGPFNGLKSISDHHANVWQGDRYQTATTVRSTRAITWFWSGLNYHLDHHLFPRIPGYNLPKLHARIHDELVARGAPVFDSYLMVMWQALKAGPMVVEEGADIISVRSKHQDAQGRDGDAGRS